MSSFHRVCVFSGTANPELATEIVTHLGMRLGEARISHFADGETFCEILENVRGVDTYIVQPTSKPANESTMELLVMADALRRASAGSITAVVPYYGYARQDRKVAPRTPISAKLCADLMTTAGITRVVSVDLHAGQIQGFFNIPFDNLYAMPVMLNEYLRRKYDHNAVFVSPDAGGVERARAYSKRLNAGLAIVDKRRERANVSEVMHLIGDVQGKDCVIVDDLVDTAGTICNAARALVDQGATSVVVCAAHPVLSGPAVERIAASPIQELVVTNTIQLSPAARACPKIRQLSVAPLLAEAIRRIHHNDSVSSLFTS
ncbi:MAG: ribose-phosphate pyrophosphokinase [Myxococcales bacterium]|nr:MAG: ribose-phosphate pyrophosphokinase [Myxococcales bacterium]